MTLIDWWHRHFTRLGRDLAWRERFARRRGYAYPGHVPRPGPWPPAPPSGRPVGPMSHAERAERFRRGMEVVHNLSPECLRMLREDGRILSEVAASVKPHPPRPRQFGRIVAGETIFPGQVVHLEAQADGSFVARARQGARHA